MNTQPKLVKYKCGYCVWRLNGKLHREDGPAVTWASGTQQWYLNGKLHREDGPAIIHPYKATIQNPSGNYPNGNEQWYLNGKQYTYEKWCKRIEIIEKRKQAKQKRHNV